MDYLTIAITFLRPNCLSAALRPGLRKLLVLRSANSGHLARYESGNISSRVTIPSVCNSISTARSVEIGALPDASWERYEALIFSFSANVAAVPRSLFRMYCFRFILVMSLVFIKPQVK
jgi:hypothetical protein